jgi:hypothetical protein
MAVKIGFPQKKSLESSTTNLDSGGFGLFPSESKP